MFKTLFFLILMLANLAGNDVYQLNKKCESGDAEACRLFGYSYEYGKGVTKDESKAVTLYEKTCDMGHAIGCTNLAFMYEKGKGTTKDESKAITFYKKACDIGDATGCSNYKFFTEKLKSKQTTSNTQESQTTAKQQEKSKIKNAGLVIVVIVLTLLIILFFIAKKYMIYELLLFFTIYLVGSLMVALYLDYKIFIDKPKISVSVEQINLSQERCISGNQKACRALSFYYASLDVNKENILNFYKYQLKAIDADPLSIGTLLSVLLFFIAWPLHFIQIGGILFNLLRIKYLFLQIAKIPNALKEFYTNFVCEMIFILNNQTSMLKCLNESYSNRERLKSYQKSNPKFMLEVAKERCGLLNEVVDETLKRDKEFIRACCEICPSFFLEIDASLLRDENFVIDSILANHELKTHLPKLGTKEMFLKAIQKDQRFLDLIPAENKTDKNFILRLAQQIGYGEALKYAKESLLDDKEFMLYILDRDYSNAVEHIPLKYKSNQEFILALAKIAGYEDAFKYADEQMIKSSEFGLEAVQRDHESFKQLPASLRENEPFILRAIEVEPKIYQHLNSNFKNDIKFLLKLIDKNAKVLSWIDLKYKTDKDFIINLGKERGFELALEYADKSLYKDKEFMLEVAKVNCGLLNEVVDETLKRDREFIRACCEICPSFFLEIDPSLLRDENFVIDSLLANHELKTHLPKLGTKEMFLKAIQKDQRFLDLIPAENKTDKNFILRLAQQIGYGEALKYAKESLLDDKEFMLYILTRDYSNAIKHIPLKYKSNQEFIFALAKIASYEDAFKYADEQMIKSSEFGLEAVQRDHESFKQLPASLRENEPFLLRAVEIEPRIYQHLNSNFKNDRNFILKLIEKNAKVLNWIDLKYKTDKDFIINLGKERGFELALEYADKSLYKEKDFMLEVAKVAYEKKESIARFLPKNLKEDREFFLFINMEE